MTLIDHMQLIKKLEIARKNQVVLNGEKVPESVAILQNMLSEENESIVRDEIYRILIFECQIIEDGAMECKYAQARYEEFKDSLSLMRYSSALFRIGDFELGVTTAKIALEKAIDEGEFVNDTAANYVRDALTTGSVAYVNDALHSFVNSLDATRTEDCKIELDWVDSAVRLGADLALIEKIRIRR